MRRVSLALIATASVALAAPAVFADDDPKAAEAVKKFQEWYDAQTQPKTPAEGKDLIAEVVKRGKQVEKDHPKGGNALVPVRQRVGQFLALQHKYDDAIAELEIVLASGVEDFLPRARYGIVKALIEKRDIPAARKRLDAFMKENKDDKSLQQLDEYLKPIEAARDMKPGASPPPLKAKTLDGKDYSIEAQNGKVVLVTFWMLSSWARPTPGIELTCLKKLWSELKDKDIEIVSVNMAEEDEEKVKAFVEKEQLGWTQILKDGMAIARAWGVKTIPRNVVLGRDGKIVALNAGIIAPAPGEKPTFSPDELVRAISAARKGEAYKPKEPPREKDPPKATDGDAPEAGLDK